MADDILSSCGWLQIAQHVPVCMRPSCIFYACNADAYFIQVVRMYDKSLGYMYAACMLILLK